MITLRQRIFIISSIVVALILVLILITVLPDNSAQEGQTASDQFGQGTQSGFPGGITSNPSAPGPLSTTPPPAFAVPSEDTYVVQLARIFVERFSSFSNQNDNVHIIDVKDLVTAGMYKWIATQDVTQSDKYEGTTTQVLSSSLEEKNENKAVVAIGAQQEISKMNGGLDGRVVKETVQKNGKVELTKVNGEWKVNGFYWE